MRSSGSGSGRNSGRGNPRGTGGGGKPRGTGGGGNPRGTGGSGNSRGAGGRGSQPTGGAGRDRDDRPKREGKPRPEERRYDVGPSGNYEGPKSGRGASARGGAKGGPKQSQGTGRGRSVPHDLP